MARVLPGGRMSEMKTSGVMTPSEEAVDAEPGRSEAKRERTGWGDVVRGMREKNMGR